ncbi:hypothetical protein DAPPUDRAFT_262125 [Daphnia pulex]|uniref:Rab-GAP TBC domain-containing protein n=1 Tax=Daphnia pulex TaxID=6669 RepID=E9HME6_DAPPU|nr:hypothetical protein DAPPUDRAFT_262125 [Daphnia pulex]|eukprot:EFX67060.1 hypothetical protein DAPPUDRAFT_262125 [Daphnia pulex]
MLYADWSRIKNQIVGRPKLLHQLKETGVSSEEIQHHQYYNQVVLDVKQILKCFPPGINENIQADLQVKVTELIIRVLIANEGLHYYQGFHDIAITL